MTAPRKPSAAQRATILLLCEGLDPRVRQDARGLWERERTLAICARDGWAKVVPGTCLVMIHGKIERRPKYEATPAGREAARRAR